MLTLSHKICVKCLMLIKQMTEKILSDRYVYACDSEKDISINQWDSL